MFGRPVVGKAINDNRLRQLVSTAAVYTWSQPGSRLETAAIVIHRAAAGAGRGFGDELVAGADNWTENAYRKALLLRRFYLAVVGGGTRATRYGAHVVVGTGRRRAPGRPSREPGGGQQATNGVGRSWHLTIEPPRSASATVRSRRPAGSFSRR